MFLLGLAKDKLVKFAGDGKTEEVSIDDALKDKKAGLESPISWEKYDAIVT